MAGLASTLVPLALARLREAVLIVDRELQVVFANQALLALLGLCVIYLDRNQAQWTQGAYGVLIAYAGFAAALFFPGFRRLVPARGSLFIRWITLARWRQ